VDFEFGGVPVFAVDDGCQWESAQLLEQGLQGRRDDL